MWCFLSALFASLLALQVAATAHVDKRHNTGHLFVTVSKNGRFLFNGTEFPLIGTTAYWLPALNAEQDIDYTLGNISQAGFNAVRVWAFNDVTSIPENGTWFQLIDGNGTVTINNGTSGLQKLDTVVRLAEKHRLFLILSLTNNWNPLPSDSAVNHTVNSTTPNNTTVQRNVLSNQYGGMDAYVRQLAHSQEHDQFYVNSSLINAFKNYTTQVVSRYVNSSFVLAWEVANDPRCNSSITASSNCSTLTVTSWHSDIAQHIQQVDHNHLISSGASGFFCSECPKLFQKVATPAPLPPAPPPTSTPQSTPPASTSTSSASTLQPTPQPSQPVGPAPPPAPPSRPSAFLGMRLPRPTESTRSLLREKRAALKKKRAIEAARRLPVEGGIRIRGRWTAPPTRRQSEDVGVGPAFNGAAGVDCEDILSIPQIGFGSFQLFPDQFSYGLVEPSGPLNFNESLAVGLEWIKRQGETATRVGKPIINVGFGLVTQNNSESFVPFNATVAAFGPAPGTQQVPIGVTDDQRDEAYKQWIQASLSSGLLGAIHYQWGQSGLSVQPGTPVFIPSNETAIVPVQNQTGASPNDGYSVQGVGQPVFVQTIQQVQQTFGSPPS